MEDHMAGHNKEKRYECNVCGSSSQLEIHRRVHTGEKPYGCSTCGKSFAWLSGLWEHRWVHSNERSCTCSNCEKRLQVVHGRLHTGERRYTCSDCGKYFTRSTRLLVNEHSHTGKQPYICAQCGKGFTRSSRLVSHERVHTGDRPVPSMESALPWPLTSCLASMCTPVASPTTARIVVRRLAARAGCGSTSGYTPERDPLCALSVARVSPACPACGSTSVPAWVSVPSPARPMVRASPSLTTCWSTGESTPATPFTCPVCGKVFVCSSSLLAHRHVDRCCLGRHEMLEGKGNVSGRDPPQSRPEMSPVLLSRDAACPTELFQYFVSFFSKLAFPFPCFYTIPVNHLCTFPKASTSIL